MALASAVAGALRPSQAITWTRGDGAAENLSGATISGKIRDAANSVRAIAGALVIIDGPAGQFRWDYAAADVVSGGEYQVQFTATFGLSPTPARTLVEQWTVYEALS